MAELFVPLDVNWPDHPKVIAAGLDGAGLHAQALCLAKRLNTDGELSRVLLHRLGAPDELIDRLVELGLFDQVDADSIAVHGWLRRNPSSAAIAARRRAKVLAGKAGNHAKWKHPGELDVCPICHPEDPRSSQGAIAPDNASDPVRSPEREGERQREGEGERCDSAPPGAHRTPTADLERARRLVRLRHDEIPAVLAELVTAHGPDAVTAALTELDQGADRFEYPSALKGTVRARIELDAARAPSRPSRPPCADCSGSTKVLDDDGMARDCPTCRPARAVAS